MTLGRLPRLLTRLVALLALLGALPWAATAAEPPTAAGPGTATGTVVGTNGVNLRDCPRPNCPVRAVAALGERLRITGDAVDGFFPVDRSGVAGWVWGLYLATPERGTPVLRSGTPGCNRVAFIFNIGVGSPTRMPILEYMERENVAATLFPMGWWAEENPDLVERMAEMGFPIGSHGDTIGNLTDRADREVSKDVRDSFATIERLIGKAPAPYFTPYAAEMDERVRRLIAEQGYLPVAWEVPAADFGADATADSVFMRVVPEIYDGAIVEFHLDAPASATSTEVALPWIVENLRNKGYRFVTIAEMAKPCDPDAATPTR